MADGQISPPQKIVTRKEAKASGGKRYYTGKPCKHGHVDWRYVCDHSCAECMRHKAARQREENPDIVKRATAARKSRYHSDPEYRARKISETAEWVAENKERARQYHKDRFVRMKDKLTAQNKALRERKKLDPEWVEQERLRNRERNKKNPEAKRSHVRKRRARIRGADGSHNAKDVASLLDGQNHKCVYCDTCLRSGYEVDHITPISRGGSNWPSNLQVLCKPCNRSKWCKDPIDFAQEKGRLF